MPGIRKYLDLGTGLQPIEPFDGVLDVHEFVLIALQDEPGTGRLVGKVAGKPGNGRGNTDEARRL